jgi:queuosine precursor transporter
MEESNSEKKRSSLYLLLSGIFITNALIAEFGGVKIFSLEKLLGLPPAHFNLLGSTLDFNLSVGVLIWPVVFVFSDIINEYFGKQGVRKISFLTAGLVGYSFIVVLLWTKMPPADFWLQLNSADPLGRPFDINFAYLSVFRAGLGIIAGSLTAFLVSQLVDAYVFHYLRRITGHRFLWLRATGSTVISQIIDSFLILIIAFYFLGNWSFGQVLKVGLVQYIYKVLLAVAFTPLIYIIHIAIDRYLGKKASVEIIDEANIHWEEK